MSKERQEARNWGQGGGGGEVKMRGGREGRKDEDSRYCELTRR